MSDDVSEKVEAAKQEALKWLLLRRGSQLEVSEEANAVLRKEHGPVNTVMICGRLRSGKSYLMNSLLRRSCFGVSSQARSFTLGIDLCPRLLRSEEIGGLSNGPKVAFTDLEGQGVKGLSQDLKLATPLLLISKVVILLELCPTGPSPESVLESLQLMMLAASFVAERKDRRGLFGSLHIVLRDCPQDEDECRSIIFDQEDENLADTDEHAQAMVKRNAIRKAIALSFEAEPSVWCLPKLSEDVAPDDYRSAPSSFVDKIDEIRQSMATQLSSPKLLDGRALTGTLIAALMPEVAMELRSDAPALNPPSLIDRVAEAEALRAVSEIVETMEKAFEELRRELPRAAIEKDMRALEEKHKALLDRRLTSLGVSSAVENARTFFESQTTALKASIIAANAAAFELLVEEVEIEFKRRIKEDLEAIVIPSAKKSFEFAAASVKEKLLDKDLKSRLEIVPTQLSELVQRSLFGHFQATLASRKALNEESLAKQQRRTHLNLGLSSSTLIVLVAALMMGMLEKQGLPSTSTLMEEAKSVDDAKLMEDAKLKAQQEEQLRLEAERIAAVEAARQHAEEETWQREEAERRSRLEEAETKKIAGVGLGITGLVLGLLKRYR